MNFLAAVRENTCILIKISFEGENLYLIPFFGAAALAEREFVQPSRVFEQRARARSFVAG